MDGLTELASPGIRGGRDGAARGAHRRPEGGGRRRHAQPARRSRGEWAAEKEAHDALGRSERARGFLSLTRAQAAGLAEDALVALRAGWTKPVAKPATVLTGPSATTFAATSDEFLVIPESLPRTGSVRTW